jgi:hypothetical protein
MEKHATYLQLKLTLRKPSYLVLSVVLGVAIIALFAAFQNSYSCTAQQLMLAEQISKYEQAPEPNLCVALAERIHQFNVACGGDLETVDCG